MGAGYLQTGYYFGFFIAAALNYTVGARVGWRAMFLCGLSPVLLSLIITLRVKEPARWKQRTDGGPDKRTGTGIFGPKYRKRTIVNAALLIVAIIGLRAGSVYEPTAIIALAKKAGMTMAEASKTASFGTVILSIGTILGCLAAPILAERLGRKKRWQSISRECASLLLLPLAGSSTWRMASGYLLPACFSWDFLAEISHCSVFGFLNSTTLLFMQRPFRLQLPSEGLWERA
jgi:MFS family permease